tara:strand:- start:1997 stop:2608 length:612 start_codon:yes stop_codon:yes gene_type:complete
MSIIKIYNESLKVSKDIAKEGVDPVRSSRRTDIMNLHMVEYLKTIFKGPKFSFKCEEKVTCSRGKKFKIDVVIYRDGKQFVLVLLKAIQSSYNKNRFNYANTTMGETSRIYDLSHTPQNLHSVWIDWVPNTVPNYNNQKELLSMETTNPCDLTLPQKRWNMFLKSCGSSIYYSKITFDCNFKSITTSKVKGEKALRNYLEALV